MTERENEQFLELRNALKWLMLDVLNRKRTENGRYVDMTLGASQPTDAALMGQAEAIFAWRPPKSGDPP